MCHPLPALGLPILLTTHIELMSKYLRICDDLLQELRVREDRAVDLCEALFVPERAEPLLVSTRERVDVFSAAVVCC